MVSKILVRRGSRLTEKSISWGLEIAVPIGLSGLLLIDLMRRKIINDKQLLFIIKAPTYLAVTGVCFGLCVYVTGRIFERIEIIGNN